MLKLAHIAGLTLILVAAGAALSGLHPFAGNVPEENMYTPAHPTVMDALKDFVGWRSQPIQPIAFTHRKHVENQIECTACHSGVTRGPVAGLPGAKVCMRCHAFFAKDRPEIQKLTATFNAGQDVTWQRVTGFSPSAHVKFNHAPHIRAAVACSQCHGDVAEMTVAVRAVNINMGFCVSCHRQRQVSTDCLTCHF